MGTATSGGGDLVARAIRAARLEDAVYEEVEADRGATVQAGIVVVVGALASAIGLGAAAAARALPGQAGLSVGAVVGDLVAALIAWAAYAYAAFLVGTTILKGPQTQADWGQVARTLGFASAPRVLLVLAVIPGLAAIVAFVVGVWLLVATVIAVRAALDVTTGRGIAIAVVAWLVLAVVNAVLVSVI